MTENQKCDRCGAEPGMPCTPIIGQNGYDHELVFAGFHQVRLYDAHVRMYDARSGNTTPRPGGPKESGPLTPAIYTESRRGLTTCNCCGVEDGSVLCVVFRWSDPTSRNLSAGSTSVSLCRGCRGLAVAALNEAP